MFNGRVVSTNFVPFVAPEKPLIEEKKPSAVPPSSTIPSSTIPSSATISTSLLMTSNVWKGTNTFDNDIHVSSVSSSNPTGLITFNSPTQGRTIANVNIITSTTNTVNLTTDNFFETIVCNCTTSGKSIIFPDTTPQMNNFWISVTNQSSTHTITVRNSLGNVIHTIPACSPGNQGSNVRFIAFHVLPMKWIVG